MLAKNTASRSIMLKKKKKTPQNEFDALSTKITLKRQEKSKCIKESFKFYHFKEFVMSTLKFRPSKRYCGNYISKKYYSITIK